VLGASHFNFMYQINHLHVYIDVIAFSFYDNKEHIHGDQGSSALVISPVLFHQLIYDNKEHICAN
jgi:hypothetical protein